MHAGCMRARIHTYMHTRMPALAHRVSRPRGTGSVGDSVGEGMTYEPMGSAGDHHQDPHAHAQRAQVASVRAGEGQAGGGVSGDAHHAYPLAFHLPRCPV